MDLKIKDVAELLSVSETTIRRWLAGGKIPAYRLNHQYRFSRIEIEKWMMSCKLDQEIGEEKQIFPLSEEEKEIPVSKTGTQHFSLFRALLNGDVLTRVSGKTKEEVIRNSMKATAPKLGLDAELATELLLDRERLMSTSLGCGVAVPHPREFISKAPVDRVILAFLDEPVDFEAFDKKPVHTLFFLFSSQDKKHLHLLAKIAHLSGSEAALEFFKSRPSKEAVLAFIKAWEGKIGGI
jgi:PTS system nitrogen regulatory IIA component